MNAKPHSDDQKSPPLTRPADTAEKSLPKLAKEVENKARRKLQARRNPVPGVWFGLGMMGLIGWSIVIPTLIGAALGIWLDRHETSGHSWTLALIVAGLTIGCFNAWHWVDKEDKAMHRERENNRNKN